MYETNPGFWGDSEAWMWEYVDDDSRIVSIYDGTDFDKADIRNKHFAVDIAWHRTHYFWNAEEAALITFGRGPDKVVKREEYVQSDDDENDFRRHNDLWKQIDERRQLIEDAQSKSVLPEIFPPAMYIDWGKRLGFSSIPRFVVQDLETVNSERKAIYSRGYVDPVSEDHSEQDTKTKRSPQQAKKENYLTKILLALLIKSDLIKRNTVDLSKMLADILVDEDARKKDKSLTVGHDTIKTRLEEAHDLLK